jgi:hypothetical protein
LEAAQHGGRAIELKAYHLSYFHALSSAGVTLASPLQRGYCKSVMNLELVKHTAHGHSAAAAAHEQ